MDFSIVSSGCYLSKVEKYDQFVVSRQASDFLMLSRRLITAAWSLPLQACLWIEEAELSFRFLVSSLQVMKKILQSPRGSTKAKTTVRRLTMMSGEREL